MVDCFSTKIQSQINEEKIVFSINGAESAGYPHVKKLQSILCTVYKN